MHLFENEIFCNIINTFTLTFDYFNASLLYKGTHLFGKKSYWPQTLNGSVGILLY